MKELEYYFNKNGITKKVTELSELQQREIHAYIESVVKPLFGELVDEFCSYNNVKATVSTSKDKTEDLKENIRLSISYISNVVFVYEPKFSIVDEKVYMTGQFYTKDIYGDNNPLQEASCVGFISKLTLKDLKNDIISVFVSNVKFKS